MEILFWGHRRTQNSFASGVSAWGPKINSRENGKNYERGKQVKRLRSLPLSRSTVYIAISRLAISFDYLLLSEQGIVAAEEWDTFMECLHKPLPSAFRVNSSGPFCDDIRLQLENDFMKSLKFELLRRSAGSVELIDVSHELPELVRRPGLKKWRVCDKGTWSASYKDVPQTRRGGIVPSMFPSGRSYSDSSADDTNLDGRPENDENYHSMEIDRQPEDNVAPADALDEEVSEWPLERSIRIVPHDQNSGAFFIAVLRKVSSLPETEIQDKSNIRHGNSVSKKSETCEKPVDMVVDETKGDDLAKPDDTTEKTTVSSPIDGVPDGNLCESGLDHDTSVAPEANEQKEVESLEGTEVVPVKPRKKRKLQMQGRNDKLQKKVQPHPVHSGYLLKDCH